MPCSLWLIVTNVMEKPAALRFGVQNGTAGSFKPSVHFYQTKQHYIQKDRNVHIQSSENLKSNIIYNCLKIAVFMKLIGPSKVNLSLFLIIS
jgi:hypothetical protein